MKTKITYGIEYYSDKFKIWLKLGEYLSQAEMNSIYKNSRKLLSIKIRRVKYITRTFIYK